MYGYIYLTTNNINGMKYIGQKKSEKFLHEKYLGSGSYLIRAIKKYGRDNFNTVLLDTADSFNELNEKEKYYIALYNAVESDGFYNQSPGGVLFGEGHIKHHTEETKRKISLKSSGENNGFYGKHHTKETREKMREAWKTRSPVSKETREKLSKVHKGKPFSESHKENLSKSLSKAMTGKKLCDSAKRKLSEYNKGTTFVNDGVKNKRIKLEKLDEYISMGFNRGLIRKSSTTIENIAQEKNLSK